MSVSSSSQPDQLVACRLSPQLLAVAALGEGTIGSPAEWHGVVEHDGGPVQLSGRSLDCSDPGADGTRAWILACPIPQQLQGAPLARLTFARRDGEESIELDSASISPAELGRRCQDRFDRGNCIRIQTFMASATRELGLTLTDELARALNEFRDSVRSELPTTKLEPGPCVVRLESIIALGDSRFWISGLIHHAEPREARITVVSPEGARSVVEPSSISYRERPAYAKTLEDDEEVSTTGYEALVALDAPSTLREGWMAEFRMADGGAFEDRARHPVQSDTKEIVEHLRDYLRRESLDESTLEGQVLPMVKALRGGSQDAQIDRIIDCGQVRTDPDVSIVVAVRRLDRIQHQLAQFVRDPQFDEAELIFVTPDATGRLAEIVDELHELYGMPFRVVKLSQPGRRQRILNLGATVARGRLLVLMSGDVLPAEPGWIGALREFHDGAATVGAVGPKLLREDDSIAQAGIEYTMRRASGKWQRKLPFAGLARTIEPAGAARRVHGVSDTCMLVDAALFSELGGFSELYLGDTDEGTDLCLRLAEAGGEAWYCPDAELYLLDQPDAPPKPSPGRDQFNEWLFGRRCGQRLASASDQRSAEAPAAPAPAAPPIPNRGTGRPGNPIEELELTTAELDGGPLLDAGLELVERGQKGQPNQPVLYDGTYAFAVTGWALARGTGPVTIRATGGVREVRQINAKLPTPELAEQYPDIPGADTAGFQFVVGTLNLPSEFELDVEARVEDDEWIPLGRIRGRRRPIRSAYKPKIQPLLVTMTGRSGSNWMITLLGSHPEVMTYQPFVYEPQLASYWTAVMRTLSDPASYMQAIQPELYEADWWTGHGRKSALPLRKPTAEMAQWFGSEAVEVLAGFCQSRLDAFYTRAAQVEGRPTPRYFAEKCVPGTARAVGELYPDAREILLVRDFRDRVCSILDFNAKRQHSLWGRDKAKTDEDWFVHLREEALNLLETWRERQHVAHLVRYEDLVLNLESTLAGVLSYLGVADDEQTVRQTITRANEWYPKAQVKHRTATSFEESVGRWKRDLSPERQAACAEAFDDILVEFGYEPSGEPGLSAASAREEGGS